MARIYTKTGDEGETSLFGGGKVPKDHPRLHAYGTLDELNGWLGWFRSRSKHKDMNDLVEIIQRDLFDLGAYLATPVSAEKARSVLPPLRDDMVETLEETIDRWSEELPPLETFLLPGGTEEAAGLHVARAVCRRAEREAIHAGSRESLPHPGLAYINRLSDLLFVMARMVNRRAKVPEPIWKPEKPKNG